MINGGYRPKGPVIKRGIIPYIGVAIEFGKNPFEYITKNKQKMGKLFSIYWLGKTTHVLTDTFSFSSIYKNSKIYDIYPVNRKIQNRLMGIPIDENTRELSETHTNVTLKALQGDNLERLTNLYYEHATEFVNKMSTKEWKRENLYEFVQNIVYESSFKAIFGDEFDVEETMKDFMYFEKNWQTYVMTDIPTYFFSSLLKSRDRLLERLSKTNPEKSHLFSVYLDFKKKFAGNLSFGILFAAMANSINASFWLVAYLLKDESLLETVKEEIKIFDIGNINKSLKEMVVLDSCVDEVFRISSQLGSMRQVTKDIKIEIEEKEYELYKGDQIFIVSTNMMDEKIYKDPLKFDYKRYFLIVKEDF
jgi:hypothetical protein